MFIDFFDFFGLLCAIKDKCFSDFLYLTFETEPMSLKWAIVTAYYLLLRVLTEIT